MVLLFIGVQYGTERVKQAIKRVVLIFSNLIEQSVQMVDRTVVVDFIPNTKQWLKGLPMGLPLSSKCTHDFHVPVL